MPRMRPIAAGREPSLLQLDVTAKAGPPTDFIYNDWYPALRTSTLREPQTTTLLNIPLLIGRKRDGSLFALRDLCPHRGIPLSAGWFDGSTVQCKYHGWRFEPCSGRCEEIPSLTTHDSLEPTRIFANAFPIAERDGYAWVYIPAPGAGRITPDDTAALPPIPSLPKFTNRFRTAHLSADLPCNVDHGIIGLMDPAHGPFVHQAWWWRSAASIHEKTKRFEPIINPFGDRDEPLAHDGFRMSPHAPSSNSAPYKLLGRPVTTIDFTLPNRRTETIVATRSGRIYTPDDALDAPSNRVPRSSPGISPQLWVPRSSQSDERDNGSPETLRVPRSSPGISPQLRVPRSSRSDERDNESPETLRVPRSSSGISPQLRVPRSSQSDERDNGSPETLRWFSSLTTVTPITPSTCRIDVVAAWNIGYYIPFVTSLVKFFGARFVGQDQQTMVEQARGLRSNPGLMLIDDADKPAKWYFALKQRRLTGTGPGSPASSAGGGGVPHPLPGPVELHWRS